MMNETVLIFCRQWPLTYALSALLAQACGLTVTPVFTLPALTRALEEYPGCPVITGFRPHEHMAALYRLQPQLSGRRVLFVERDFYWTDYCLPDFFGLERAGFCTLDMLYGMAEYPEMLQRLLRPPVERRGRTGAWRGSALTTAGLLDAGNTWLYDRMAEDGLSSLVREVMLRLAENGQSGLPARTGSACKTRGLDRLLMRRHPCSLLRGIRLRASLQAPLPGDGAGWRRDNTGKRDESR